jgi:hypothetical protein
VARELHEWSEKLCASHDGKGRARSVTAAAQQCVTGDPFWHIWLQFNHSPGQLWDNLGLG